MFDESSHDHTAFEHSHSHSAAQHSSLAPHAAWEPRVTRVGATLRSLILFCCGGALLITAAIILDPGTLLARVKTAKEDAAATESRRVFTNTLAQLIAQSHHVLAVHPRGDGQLAGAPYSEILLWESNHHNPNQIDADEIALISHSDLLQAITIYKMDDERDLVGVRLTTLGPWPAIQQTWHVSPPAQNTAQISTDSPFTPAFCDRWRALPSVQPKVLASGILDMKLLPAAPDQSASPNPTNRSESSKPLSSHAPARLWLRWTSDLSDAGVITVSRDIR